MQSLRRLVQQAISSVQGFKLLRKDFLLGACSSPTLSHPGVARQASQSAGTPDPVQGTQPGTSEVWQLQAITSDISSQTLFTGCASHRRYFNTNMPRTCATSSAISKRRAVASSAAPDNKSTSVPPSRYSVMTKRSCFVSQAPNNLQQWTRQVHGLPMQDPERWLQTNLPGWFGDFHPSSMPTHV